MKKHDAGFDFSWGQGGEASPNNRLCAKASGAIRQHTVIGVAVAIPTTI